MDNIRNVKYVTFGDSAPRDQDTLKIDHVIFYTDKDLMLIVLNNGDIIKAVISDYPLLKNATQQELETVEILLQGIALHWEKFDEDLSLHGFLTDAALNDTLQKVESIKIDPRDSKEKVIFMCIYLNVGNMSMQKCEEELAKLVETYKPLANKYANIFKGFDMLYMPVQDQNTKVEFFIL